MATITKSLGHSTFGVFSSKDYEDFHVRVFYNGRFQTDGDINSDSLSVDQKTLYNSFQSLLVQDKSKTISDMVNKAKTLGFVPDFKACYYAGLLDIALYTRSQRELTKEDMVAMFDPRFDVKELFPLEVSPALIPAIRP